MAVLVLVLLAGVVVMIVVPNEGRQYLLSLLLRDAVSSGLKFLLGLYKNDFTPVVTSVLADVEEATFSGYAVVEMVRANWTAPVIVSDVAQSLYDTAFQQWVPASGTQDIYGYFVRDEDSNFLLWAERFAAPISASPTVPVILKPVLRMWSRSQFG